MRIRVFAKITLSVALSLLFAQSIFANTNPSSLARQAVTGDPKEAALAIAELRAMGQSGLDTLFEVYGNEIKSLASGDAATAQNESLQRISAALDSVSQQRNSYASRLYWYTDLEKAKAAARASGKPILSLRLLGNLNEEYSCANSRFFRTALYANKTVADVLRERFILHWKSVRPAPRVTIDFGDGRKIERTLTGNSIHYILASDGEVIDALPGLYGPQSFLRGLAQAEAINKRMAGQNEELRATLLERFHRDRVEAIGKQWAADAAKVGTKIPESILRDETSGQSFDARVAARSAMSKMVSEIGIIDAISYDVKQLDQATDEAVWTRIASLHADDSRLDQDSIALIRKQNSSEAATAVKDEQLLRTVSNFERYLAFDTVRNEYKMHSKLHAWLSTGMRIEDVETLNERVYKDLFLTPSSDPWLGLYSPDTYTALENGGISK
jgi:hypothetical protein